MDTEPVLPFELSGVQRTCEEVWAGIRDRHPELPEVVIMVGAGERRGKLETLGHWSAARWRVPRKDGPAHVGEVMIAAEGFKFGAAEALDTLLHEAAHALAWVRKIQDTSRGCRYHNKRYAAIAREVGLVVEEMGKHGWAKTTVPPQTLLAYNAEVTMLSLSLSAWRRVRRDDGDEATPEEEGEGEGKEGEGEGEGGTRTGGGARGLFVCKCTQPRKIRVSAAVMALGPILCGVCSSAFAAPEPTAEAEAPASAEAA